MANVQHNALTGSELHEPKGVDSASVDTVYVTDGAGSGAHQKIETDQIDTASIFGINTYYTTVVLSDVSSASSVLAPIQDASLLESISTILGGALSGSDASISFTRNGSDSLGSAITVTAGGSAEGDQDSFTPSQNADISANGYIKITSDGGSTNAVPLYVSLKFTRTA